MIPTFRSNLVLLLAALLISCSSEFHEIEFRGLTDLKVTGLKEGKLQVSGLAVFHNPNDRNVRLNKADVDVYLNGEKVAKLKPDGPVRIRKQSNFVIPVTAEVPLGDKEVLGGIFSIFTGGNRVVEFKGHIVLRSWMVPFKVPIDHRADL